MPGLDLEAISRSVLKLRAEVPEDAFTAGILGSQRTGNGVVINSDGLILTIGYLVTEATDVWLTTPDGRELAGASRYSVARRGDFWSAVKDERIQSAILGHGFDL